MGAKKGERGKSILITVNKETAEFLDKMKREDGISTSKLIEILLKRLKEFKESR